ncbi:MAG: hypothetical protein A2W51_02790 [Candidatus Zambryskibacteria bacterium RIFCSPHIGHO2_02_39_10]|nr:MAG: hypothetical protein A2W51_02790 [Candidatus Zambryskibacteria bacterium RIFCSPHIGHO2_02_39_10]
MSIKEILEKINPFYTLILLIVVAGIFFGLGRLSKLEETKTPIKIEYANRDQTSAVITATSQNEVEKKAVVKEVIPADGPVIGSKSGKKYYFPWCGTVKRILPQNQVHFASIEEARKAGFTPGGNCKGLW